MQISLCRRAVWTVPAILLLLPGFAAAQMPLSKWGNPVFSVGQTPYYAHDAGHGNIPGGYGFTPGYGYYPGNNIPGTTYPWLSGPDVPDYFDGPRALQGSTLRPPPPPALNPAVALLAVRVPADAEIWVEGVKTKQQGWLRSFVTPPLDKGELFTYAIRARWKENGKDVDRSKEISVRCGDRLTIDFLGATEDVLPPPRKLDVP